MRGSRLMKSGALAIALASTFVACRAFLDFSDSPEPSDASEDAASVDAPEPTDAGDAGFVCPPYIPEEGIYSYGSQSFSTPGEEQLFILTGGKEPDAAVVDAPIGPTFTAIVTHGAGGAWTFAVHLNLNHVETYDFVSDGGLKVPRVVENFLGIPVAVDCSPPVDAIRCPMVAGATWAGAGAGTFGADASPINASLAFTYVGIENMPVEGNLVATYHVKEERQLLNAVSGHQSNEYWYSVDNGLLVHGKITVGVIGSHKIDGIQFTALGTDEYKASAEYGLISLTPAPLLVDSGADGGG